MAYIHPYQYLGKNKKGKYFEGWYYKLTTGDYSIALIPGVAKGKDPHGFVQFLDSNGLSGYSRYSVDELEFNGEGYWIKAADNAFGGDGISLNINIDGVTVKGRIDFTDKVDYPRTALHRGSMGAYGFLPFLSGYHDVIRIRQTLIGGLEINGAPVIFDGGRGYIEKNWGQSFPSEWLWVQADSFGDKTSMMMALANIKIAGIKKTGVIAMVYTGGKLYRLTSPLGAKVTGWEQGKGGTVVTGDYKLEVSIEAGSGGEFKGPDMGDMSIPVADDITAVVTAKLSDKGGNIIFEGSSGLGGYEYNLITK